MRTVSDVDQLARRSIQPIDCDGPVCPVAGRDEDNALAAKLEAFAKVDIVHLAVRKILNDLALHVVDEQTALLVGRDDQALGWICRIGPDRRIVRRISKARNGDCLDHGGDGRHCRFCCRSRVARCADGNLEVRRDVCKRKRLEV